MFSRTPSIPEVLKGGHESGLGSVEPRQFINENHHLFPGPFTIEQIFQFVKGIEPAYKRAIQLGPIFLKGMGELLQLNFVKKFLILIF